jgi:hypothetical protein
MKREPYPGRDPAIWDIYERTMQPYRDLLAEAEHARLLRQISSTGPVRQSLFGKSLVAFGSMLIFLGVRFQAAGRMNSNRARILRESEEKIG